MFKIVVDPETLQEPGDDGVGIGVNPVIRRDRGKFLLSAGTCGRRLRLLGPEGGGAQETRLQEASTSQFHALAAALYQNQDSERFIRRNARTFGLLPH